MLGTGCLHQRTTLSSACTFSPPAQGQGGADFSALKTHKGSCPDQQRVSAVGKLCVTTPHFQAPGVHTAGETPVPYSTNTETEPPLPKPAPVSQDFPSCVNLPLVIYTKCNVFSSVLQFSIDPLSPFFFSCCLNSATLSGSAIQDFKVTKLKSSATIAVLTPSGSGCPLLSCSLSHEFSSQ